MRISDWSSDVCSSDLVGPKRGYASMPPSASRQNFSEEPPPTGSISPMRASTAPGRASRWERLAATDRKSGVQGKRVSVRVDRGGRRISKEQKEQNNMYKCVRAGECHVPEEDEE